jgi:hypothetical protein
MQIDTRKLLAFSAVHFSAELEWVSGKVFTTQIVFREWLGFSIYWVNFRSQWCGLANVVIPDFSAG